MSKVEDRASWLQEHAEALDKNWQAHHDACVNAIRGALGMPEASIPDMVRRIDALNRSEFLMPDLISANRMALAQLRSENHEGTWGDTVGYLKAVIARAEESKEGTR